MAHAAVEGLEVAAAVAELADAAMGAYERRKHHAVAVQRDAEEALVKERAENDKLRSALDMYRDVIQEFSSRGLLEHMHQLNGMDPDQLCDKLKERVDSPEFLEKLGTIVLSKDKEDGEKENTWVVLDGMEGAEDYVVITQEDIVDSIASYMAKYLATQPKAQNMSPDELQNALSKAFSAKDKPGFFRRLWGAGKVMYTIASWTATGVGLYRNPVLVRAAFMAIRTTVTLLLRLLR
ncbi:uncharacterized protein LOC112349964 [Selaginella moellendorffii]|uniref:uncharacterized protein LOC112349964 n=1 Tax=Selaginella moellendorffii TaxID=88036 RepID=UPI000D1C5E63|nr:uncharacterized protein LOC112349964 [Selaginella moellendorffii]|eukprot:XP_024541076.1 uncharacterized protein LOC112349964 [Selaginella moellendorffii]